MAVFTQTISDIIKRKPEEIPRDVYLGLDKYPVNSGFNREQLNDRIVEHFYMREIGLETREYFAYKMNVKMQEIMPKYNLLFETVGSHWDTVFKTIDIKNVGTNAQNQTRNGSDNGTNAEHTVGTSNEDTNTTNVANSTSDATGHNEGRAVVSNTPQTQLSGNGDYASGLTDSVSDNTQVNTGNQTTNGTVDKNTTSTVDSSGSNTDIRHDTLEANGSRDSETTGYNGIPAQLITAYRESIINVVVLIIGELNELFMSVWDNGDDQYIKYHPREWAI